MKNKEKTYDCVKMMRDIREDLSMRYSNNSALFREEMARASTELHQLVHQNRQ